MRGHVTIVGAGIVGLATAFRLAREGWIVTILETGGPGQGASKAALGSLTPYSDHGCNAATKSLAENSLAGYPEWIKELEQISSQRIDFDAPGLLELAIGTDELETLKDTFSRLREGGAPVDWLSSSEARELEPEITAETLAAIYYKTEAIVDVAQLIFACEEAVRRIGCVIASNTRATRLLDKGGSLVGIETTAGRIRTDIAVLCPGADLSQIDGLPAIHMDRVRGEVIEVRGVPGIIRRHLYCGDGFMTPRADGRILLGSNYDVHAVGDDECRTTISAGIALRTLSATIRMVPALQSLQLQQTWKGWRPRSPDGQPIIGCIGPRGVYVATGFFGLGITLAPAVADALCALFDGRPPDELNSLSPERFLSQVDQSNR